MTSASKSTSIHIGNHRSIEEDICCVPKLLICTTKSSLIYAFMRQGNDKIFSDEDSNHLLIQLHA